MDFQKVLEALDHLIEKRVESAAYTRMLTAIVQDIENSEKNTYKVSYDNGKTNTIAISIAPNGNEIQYQKGDSVQLLQYNGIGNTNTVLYILGKSKDFTDQNLIDLEDYFTSITVFPIDKFDINKKFTLQDGTSVIENIKEYGSFILKAKFTVDDSNKIYNYGIKIILNFTNDIKPVEYIFDIYQMIGQPWLYQNMEQSYQQKIDDFYLPYLKSITLTKFVDERHSITISDMEISSAILNVSNDYIAMFRGSKKSVDFITDHQDNKASTTLQTIFYKNGQTFASSSCKYYWFIRDDSIEIDSEYYHKYGSVGWKCLNSYETIEYLNETPQKIFNNNIGDTLIIDQNNAPHYHNYYKCIVEYGLRIAATQEREILNLDNTALSFNLTTDNSVITKLDENTVLNIKLDLNDSDKQVNLIKWSYQKDNTGFREYIIDKGTEKELNLANAENTEAASKISNILGLQHTTFYCTLINTSVTPIVTLGEAKLIITRDLSIELTEEIWYYDNGNSIIPPKAVNTTDKSWSTTVPNDVENKYVFAAKRMVSATYHGPFGDIYCYSARGIGAAAAQLTEFNRLTNNGKDQGLYYSKDDNQNKLYINADYINTGTLRVGEKFYASINSKDVKIGGFIVDDKSFVSENKKIGFSQGTDTGTDKWVLWTGATDSTHLETAPFRVSTTGALYSTSGEIGGFTIGKNSIYHSQDGGGAVGLFSKNTSNKDIAIYVTPSAGTNTDGFYVDYNGNVYCKKVFSVGTKDEGFSIDEKGKVNWTPNNTPIKYIYCSTYLTIPKDTAYDKFPDISENTWHVNYNQEKDHWYAVSTSGTAGSFNGPLRLDGQNGKDGDPGKPGSDGKSAYEVAVENGYEGSEEQWLASLKGEKGADGTAKIETIEGTAEKPTITTTEIINKLDANTVTVINLKNCGVKDDGQELSLPIGNWSITVTGW